MQLTLTKPIEEFIRQQLDRGYADASEVARQAFLRWMEDENYPVDPPRLRDKLPVRLTVASSTRINRRLTTP